MSNAEINRDYNPICRKPLFQKVELNLTGLQYGVLWELLSDSIDNVKLKIYREELIQIWEELTGDKYE